MTPTRFARSALSRAGLRAQAGAGVRVQPEGGMLVATLGCPGLAPETALARQPELLAPVKLAAAAGGGAELRAELLRARGVDTEALARSALERAGVWLAGDGGPVADVEAVDAEEVAAGLAELPRAWAWEPRGADGFHVHATAFGTSARIVVEARAGTARAFVRSAVPATGLETRAALVHFALEANARLRLARIGVAADDDGTARLTWDAVASPGVALERALPAAVEAVAGAHAATRRALRALSHAAVARIYLDARAPRAGDLPA